MVLGEAVNFPPSGWQVVVDGWIVRDEQIQEETGLSKLVLVSFSDCGWWSLVLVNGHWFWLMVIGWLCQGWADPRGEWRWGEQTREDWKKACAGILGRPLYVCICMVWYLGHHIFVFVWFEDRQELRKHAQVFQPGNLSERPYVCIYNLWWPTILFRWQSIKHPTDRSVQIKLLDVSVEVEV